MNEIDRLKEIINNSSNIVFFTGAGVSTESNIPDFRSATGLSTKTTKYPLEVMLSHTFFMKETAAFYEFYKNNMLYIDAQPNIAHLKMAELEKAGKVKAIVTQNIDNLHYLAGSKNVYELHGNVNRNYCMKCHKSYDVNYIIKANGIPHCSCGGIIKPDVVLYEEALDDAVIDSALNAIMQADCLIVAGTSLSVYPASGLINYFRGNHLVLINKSKTLYDERADLVINALVGETLKAV